MHRQYKLANSRKEIKNEVERDDNMSKDDYSYEYGLRDVNEKIYAVRKIRRSQKTQTK